MDESLVGRYQANVVIIGEAGRERDSLELVLASNGQIGRVSLLNDLAVAVPAVIELKPALVIVLQTFSVEAVLLFVRVIQSVHPQTRCVVVSENDSYHRLLQSREPYAVLYRGFPTEHLFAVIDQLLTDLQSH